MRSALLPYLALAAVWAAGCVTAQSAVTAQSHCSAPRAPIGFVIVHITSYAVNDGGAGCVVTPKKKLTS